MILTRELLHDSGYFPNKLSHRNALVVRHEVDLSRLTSLPHEDSRVRTHAAIDHANLMDGKKDERKLIYVNAWAKKQQGLRMRNEESLLPSPRLGRHPLSPAEEKRSFSVCCFASLPLV